MVSLIGGIKKVKLIETESRKVVARGWEVWRNREKLVKRYKLKSNRMNKI